jgi:hypothetical protein
MIFNNKLHMKIILNLNELNKQNNNLVIATMPDLAQADGSTKPEPVSAYVVIIERNDAAIFKINILLFNLYFKY